MKKVKTLFMVFVILMASVLLFACSQPTEETPVVEETKEVSETEVTQEPAQETDIDLPRLETLSKDILLDPAVALDTDSMKVNALLYEGLVRLSDDGTVESALAGNWEISTDELDYIFYLKPNLLFHDGSTLTADIVLDNFNRWFDPDNPLHGNDEKYQTWKKYFLGFRGELDKQDRPVSVFDGIEKVDDLTVLVHLNRPIPEFLVYMADPAFSIINVDVLSTEGEAYGTEAGSAIGTGPYLLETWESGILTLAPFGDYWEEVVDSSIQFKLE